MSLAPTRKTLLALVLLTALLGVLLFFARGIAAHAAEVKLPHIVVSGQVYLESEDGAKLFRLPDGYYIKINNLDEKYYFISFNGVSGKVNKNAVSSTGYSGAAVSTSVTLGVNQAYLDFVGIHIKKTPSIISDTVLSIPTTASFIFVGDYLEDGKLWYYVRYEQYFGYIQAERTSDPSVTPPAFVPQEESEPTTADPVQPPKGSPFDKLKGGGELRAIIIVGVAIPVLLIVLLIFKPGKKYDSE